MHFQDAEGLQFIHQMLLSIPCVPGTILGTWDAGLNKADSIPAFIGSFITQEFIVEDSGVDEKDGKRRLSQLWGPWMPH